jgi:hypothetical protein
MLAAPLSKRADVREKLSKAAKARDLVHDERGRIVTWKKSG